jgi:hypothetical protein
MLSWLAAFFAIGAVQSAPVASLRVDANQATFLVTIEEDHSHGYQVQIKCVAKCSRQIIYRESIGDSPMGLFCNDNGLIFSSWAGGSAYRVRVWRVTDHEIKKIGELASWHRPPEFMTDRFGRPVVRTYEGGFDFALSLRPVSWIYKNGRFLRQARKGS